MSLHLHENHHSCTAIVYNLHFRKMYHYYYLGGGIMKLLVNRIYQM
jgi:hypothetical protein